MRLLLLIISFSVIQVFGADIVSGVKSPTFKKDELESLQKSLGIRIGEPLNLQVIETGVKNLYSTENQRLIFIEIEKQGNQIFVIIRGTKFRKLKNIKFTGVFDDVKETILKNGDLEIGKNIDLSKLSLIREKIKSEYATLGYPAASVQVEMDEEEKGGVQVEVTVTRNEATKVSKIIFQGVKDEEANDLYERIPLKKGGIYSKKSVDETVDALRNYFRRNRRSTSRVEETSIHLSPDRLSAEVVLQVRLGDQYQFQFVGNKEFEEIELRLLLTEEALSQVDAMQRIGDEIEKKYRRAGFHFIHVDTKIEIIKETKTQIVRFEINEGERVRIDRVLFNGSNLLKESELSSLFFETAPGVLSRALFWEEGLPDATVRLREKLESKGFLSASLTGPRVAFSPDKKGVELIYDADLGNRSIFRNTEILGNHAISEKEIRDTLPYRSGDEINWDRVKEMKAAVLRKYYSKGYLDVVLEEAADKKGLVLSPDQRDGDFIVHIKEGSPYTVGNISIEGNRRTKDKVILREVTLEPNQPFDPEKIKESEENIAILQLFSRVEIVTFPNPQDKLKKDLKIIVVEIKPGTGEVGLGGAYEEPRFRARSFLGLQYRNLWGLNQTASQRTELTIPLSHQQTLIPFIEYAINLGYRAPYLLDLPFTFFAQAGLDSYEISPLGGTPVLQTRARIEERIEKKLGKRVTAIYRLHRYERTTVENLVDTPSKTTNSIGSTGPGLIVDLRDDPFNPTKGSYHTLDVEYAHPNLLSESSISFAMAIVRNSFYFPLSSGGLGLIVYGGAGYAKSFYDSPIPVTRLASDLSLGGQSSLRGYSSKEYQPDVHYQDDEVYLNPRETVFINGRIEIVSPIFENVAGALFFDSGQLYPHLVPAGRKDGLGFGIRYKTPVGPIVIDIAHGFESRDKNVKFTFTIGTI